MPDILLTGMPRSGTTLVVSLLAAQPDCIALAEPIELSPDGDRARAVADIENFMRMTRRAAAANEPLVTKHVGGRLVDNWFEPPHPAGQLRRLLEERSPLRFDKSLSNDFTLVVKHPGGFTALADLLAERFPLYAIIRDPLAVLAAWQTVDMPVGRGYMPMAEAFHPDLHSRLAKTPDRIARQIKLIEWHLTTYLSLPLDRVIRYEDIVADPKAALGRIMPINGAAPKLSLYDPIERYGGVDFKSLAAALAPLRPLIARFYPDFEHSWNGQAGRFLDRTERRLN